MNREKRERERERAEMTTTGFPNICRAFMGDARLKGRGKRGKQADRQTQTGERRKGGGGVRSTSHISNDRFGENFCDKPIFS